MFSRSSGILKTLVAAVGALIILCSASTVRSRMFVESSLVFAMAASGGVATASVMRARICTVAASSLFNEGGQTRFSCGSRQVGIVLSRGSGPFAVAMSDR